MKRLILLFGILLFSVSVSFAATTTQSMGGYTFTVTTNADGSQVWTVNGKSMTVTAADVQSGNYYSKVMAWVMSWLTIDAGPMGNTAAVSGFQTQNQLTNRALTGLSYAQADIERAEREGSATEDDAADMESGGDETDAESGDAEKPMTRAEKARAAREAKAKAEREAQDRAEDMDDPFIRAIKRTYNTLDGGYSFSGDAKDAQGQNSWGGLYTLPFGARVKAGKGGSFTVSTSGLMVGFRSVFDTSTPNVWQGDLISLGFSGGRAIYTSDKKLDVGKSMSTTSLLFDLGLNKSYKISYFGVNLSLGYSYPISIGTFTLTPNWGLNPHLSMYTSDIGGIAFGNYGKGAPTFGFGVNLPIGLAMNLRLGDDFIVMGNATGNVNVVNLNMSGSVGLPGIEYLRFPNAGLEVAASFRIRFTDTFSLVPKIGVRGNLTFAAGDLFSTTFGGKTRSAWEPYLSISL